MVGSCDPATGVAYTPSPGTACGDNSNKCGVTHVCDASGTCQSNPAPVVSPPNRCYTGACDPSTGNVTYTPVAGCDPNPTTPNGSAFETQASLIGKVVLSGTGAPVTGYTITAYDDTTANPRSDVSLTVADDGSFRARLTSFPTTEPPRSAPHHVLINVSSPNFLTIQRSAYLHPGVAKNFGEIHAVARDPKITTIDASGGTATDSQGLVEVDIPPGALTAPTPIQITPLKSRADAPYPLPDVTLPGYSMELEPEGTQFQVPVTVRLANWRNLPTTFQIPVGVVDKTTGFWTHEAFANWDGKMFAFNVNHFSYHDANMPELDIAIFKITRGKNVTNTDHQCGASTFGLANGTLRQSFDLPGVQRRGVNYAVGLNYDSLLTYGEDTTSAPPPAASGGNAAVPTSTIESSGSGLSVQMSCVPAPVAQQILATQPGTCAGGACTPGKVAQLPPGLGLHLVHPTSNGDTSDTNVSLDPDGNSVIFESDIPIPLPLTADGALDPSGYTTTTVGIEQHGSGCTVPSLAFGSTGSSTTPPVTFVPGNNDPIPLASIEMPTFVYHRHTSPYGVGWGLNSIGHLYKDPQGSEAVIVSGEGDEEFFYPRTRATSFGAAVNGVTAFAHALDPQTGQVFRSSWAKNAIEQVSTTDATPTTVVSGLGLTDNPQMMAIGYVAGVRHFLIADMKALVDVPANGAPRVLMTRPNPIEGKSFLWYASGVAVVGKYAYYATGTTGTKISANTSPELYRFDLTQATPAAEPLSAGSNGNWGLHPTVPISGYTFGDAHGLAPAPDGGLYVADRSQNVIFEILPDANGEVAPDSTLVPVIGSGESHAISPIGLWQPALEFSMASPGYLFNAPDGLLWIFTTYGAAAYDPVRKEVRWLVQDIEVPGSENNFSLYDPSGVYPSVIPVGPTTLFGTAGSVVYRYDIDLYSSETDPTRTLSFSGGAATVTDTTSDLVEAYDPNGRLVERQTREGDPILSVSYASPTSDTVAAITDPTGGSSTFTYASGLLSSVTDAAGRTTNVVIDGGGDLKSFTKPDGETWTFEYADHRMVKKTSPEGDVTTYEFDPTDHTLRKATKPAGEVITMTPGYAITGVDATGNPTHTSTYTDDHGVTHTVTLDQRGREVADSYTADGQAYTVQHDRVTWLGSDTNGSDSNTWLSNQRIGRDRRLLVNGLGQGDRQLFDGFGRWIGAQIAQGLGGIATLTYDSNGREQGYNPSAGNFFDTYSTTRDANGRAIKVAELGNAPREDDYSWNADGTLHTSTTHGVTTTYTYDPTTLNVATTTDTLGQVTSFTYDAAGNVLTATNGGSTTPTPGDGSATTWTFAHDGANRVSSATDAEGNTTTFGYVQKTCGCSESSLLTSLQTPDLAALGKGWAFGYGANGTTGAEGRLTSVTDPDGNVSTFDYERTGELRQLIDGNKHGTSITHDSFGRVLTMVDALGRTHARGYTTPVSGLWSGQDVLSGSASGAAASTNFTQALNVGDYQLGTNLYDLKGNGTTTSPYFTQGKWASVEFYRDATFQLSYGRGVDYFGRTTGAFDRPSSQLTSTTVQPTGSGTLSASTFGYANAAPIPLLTGQSAATGISGYSYNAQYDLVSSYGDQVNDSGAIGNTNYTLDTAGRVTGVQTILYGTATQGNPNFTLSQGYSYYPNGRVQKTPQGTLTYDDRGLVATRQVDAGTYVYQYDALGRNSLLTYPDGHTRTQGYDNEGRVNSRCYDYPASGLHRCYGATYDAAGNPTTLTDHEGSDTIAYDPLDRVTGVSRVTAGGSTTEDGTEAYSYNKIGALNTNAGVVIDDQRPLLSGAGTGDSAIPNSYGGQPITVDGEGKITSLAGTGVGYNLKGYATSLAGKGLHRDEYMRIAGDDAAGGVYTYDGANRSGFWVWGSVGGKAQWVRRGFWLYDGVDHPLEHDDDSGNRQFYELDLAGNVRRLVASGGADLGGYRYTAFGETYAADALTPAPQGAASLPVRWKGRWLLFSASAGTQNALELYDMRARIWCPHLGIFVSVDSFSYHSTTTALWGWPGQNPLKYNDPSGHLGEAGAAATAIEEGASAAEAGAAAGEVSGVYALGTGASLGTGGGAVAAAPVAVIAIGVGAIGWSAYEISSDLFDYNFPKVATASNPLGIRRYPWTWMWLHRPDAVNDNAGEGGGEPPDDMCEKSYASDTATCNQITCSRGAEKGAECHASAAARYAACLAGKPGSQWPGLNTWNN